MPESRYTLVIPTYNRPEDLARLLRFLAHQQARFRILVLDSSRPENQERNAAQAKNLALDLSIERFDSNMPPWEKFSRGAELVTTKFSSLCADDDLVLVSSIEPLVEFLDRNLDYSLAHGWYFNFYLNGALGLTAIAYKGASIDENDPLERLHHLFRSYEALTYGLYRTPVLQEALRRVQGLESMLGRELLGGAIAVVAGKVARLPVLYAGRSLGPSAPYTDWHPAEFLLSSPQNLFSEYVRYRALLLDSYTGTGRTVTDDVVKMVDLIHLRYLADYFTPDVIDYLIGHTRSNTQRTDIVGGLWPVLAGKQGVEGALHGSSILRRLRDRTFPWVRGYHVRKLLSPSTYTSVSGTTASGKSRSFQVYEAFRRSLAENDIRPSISELTVTLQSYE